MPYNNISINIHTLNSEQHHQFFLELFDMEPSLLNALNSEQRRRLHSVLIAIDPSLTEPLLDARSAVRGIINEQLIKKKKKVTEAKANGYALPSKKKNVKPSIRGHSGNINKANIESIHIQKRNSNTNNVNIDLSDADETDNTQDFLGDNSDSNNFKSNDNGKTGAYEISHNSDTLTTAIDSSSYTDAENISSQDDLSTLVKNSITSNNDQSNKITPDNVSSPLKKILRSSVQKHDKIKNTEHNVQNSGTSSDIDGKKKRGRKAKEPSSHRARITKKAKK
ncbi:8295_t:CDS:2, partial [Cetraspora pellucida]